MDSIEYLKKHREKAGLSFRKMAKKAGVSDGYWYILFDTNNPPTIEKAAQIARGTDMDVDLFLNLVFRDRMLKFLEKEGVFDNSVPEDIKKIIQVFKEWDPHKGNLSECIKIYYVNYKGVDFPLTRGQLANIYGVLRPSLNITDKTVLTRSRKNTVGGCEKEVGGGTRGSGRGHILGGSSKGFAVMVV